MIKGIHHLAVTTDDPQAMIAFYETMFSARVLRRFVWEKGNAAYDAAIGVPGSGGEIVVLDLGAMKMELFTFAGGAEGSGAGHRPISRSGYTHIAFEVDDCRAEFERLNGLGMAFKAAPYTMPAGGVFAYGHDPDGNVIEILQLPPPA